MPSEKVAGVLERLGVDVPAESLSHYGVPGMKWGQRKASDSGSSKSKKAPIGSVERMHQDAKAQGLVFDKKTNSYSPPGQPKASAETMARVRVAAAGKGAAISKSQIRADVKMIRKIDRRDTKIQGQRLQGISRIMEFGGSAKKANRESTRKLVNSILLGATGVAIVGVAAASVSAPPVFLAGASVMAALSSAGVMNRTIKDTRNVNSAAGVFNPNTLLNRTNNG